MADVLRVAINAGVLRIFSPAFLCGLLVESILQFMRGFFEALLTAKRLDKL